MAEQRASDAGPSTTCRRGCRRSTSAHAARSVCMRGGWSRASDGRRPMARDAGLLTSSSRNDLLRQLLDRHGRVALAPDELCENDGRHQISVWRASRPAYGVKRARARAPMVCSLSLSLHPQSISFCRRCSLSLYKARGRIVEAAGTRDEQLQAGNSHG